MSIWPGEELLGKIWESFAKGFGKIYEPRAIRKEGEAKTEVEISDMRKKAIALEQLRQEFLDVRAGKKIITEKNEIVPIQLSHKQIKTEENLGQDLIETVANTRISPSKLIEFERRINLEQIALLAYEEAINDESKEPIEQEEIDPDWFAQWRNHAQDVSNDKMQRLWAKILKGEARRKNTFSMRTLSFLSTMSSEDANLIAKVGNFVLSSGFMIFFPMNKDFCESMKNAGISYTDLLDLEDLGILNGVTGGGRIQQGFEYQGDDPKYVMVKYIQHALVFFAQNIESTKLHISGISVSKTGQELLSLATRIEDSDYLKEIADYYRSQTSEIKLAVIENQIGESFAAKTLHSM